MAFEVVSATEIAFTDDSSDSTPMVHVGMNIEDKVMMMKQMARGARPKSTTLVYAVTRVGDGDLIDPLPWVSGEKFTFLDEREVCENAAASAGLTLTSVHDHGEMTLEVFNKPSASPLPVNLGHLMGSDMPTMFGNLGESVNAGIMSSAIPEFAI